MKIEEMWKVQDKIPDNFYPCLLGNLVSIMGEEIGRTDDNVNTYDYNSGTAGWNLAIILAAKRAGCEWLIDFYKDLNWIDSDYFDSLIEERLANLTYEDHSDYYQWLLSQNKM